MSSEQDRPIATANLFHRVGQLHIPYRFTRPSGRQNSHQLHSMLPITCRRAPSHSRIALLYQLLDDSMAETQRLLCEPESVAAIPNVDREAGATAQAMILAQLVEDEHLDEIGLEQFISQTVDRALDMRRRMDAKS